MCVQDRLHKLEKQLENIKSQNLKLDMTRGKPSHEQIELSSSMLTILDKRKVEDYKTVDVQNYGVLDGLVELREFFATLLNSQKELIFIGGNSSLNLMHDVISFAMMHGFPESSQPWVREETIKFLCPAPGYDRHFAICEHFNIEMIAVPMKSDGPDIEKVADLVAQDDSIKGMWCVPKYQNPTGITFSDKVIDALASMETKAKDFKLFWDNAYVVHDLGEDKDVLSDIHQACISYGHDNRVVEFASTSKITFPGAGVALIHTQSSNMDWLKQHFSYQNIGYDKINQLRHLAFFKDIKGLYKHMKHHANILRPKFLLVDSMLSQLPENMVSWTKPKGGYFISLNTKKGLAKDVVNLVADLGVKLTPAGATYPYNEDPDDSNIRLAPSMPDLGDIEQAMQVLVVVIEYLTLKKSTAS